MHLYPLIKGLIIGFIIAIPTGPVGFLCIKRALTRHYRDSVSSALGSVTADLIFGLIVIFGLTTVSHFFIAEQNTIRLFGGLLLLYVGIKTFFNIAPAAIPLLDKYENLGNFASTFTLTMTNPVQIITLPVVFAAIGSGVSPGNYSEALLFIAGLAIGSCITWVLLIGLVSSLKKHIKKDHYDFINKISGTLIVATGLFILFNLAFQWLF